MTKDAAPETELGRALFGELQWVHDVLRRDLATVERLAAEVTEGLSGPELERELDTLRTAGPLWQLKVNCLRYCRFVHHHHRIEDVALFPALRRSDPSLGPVVDRLEADHLRVSELDQPVTGVPTVTLGGVNPAEARILGRGRPFAPGTGHSEAETLDSTLCSAPLRNISDDECARAFKGYKNPTGERFDPRMRCAIDADGEEPLYSGCFGDSGGPLWTGTADAPVQLGVVSWGGNCGADHRPSVFADVALYRDFITDPNPTWAPTKTGTAKISGTPRVGRKLTCSAPSYTPETGAKVGYTWKFVGVGRSGYHRPTPVGHGKTHKVTRADRNHRLACFVDATNDGGSTLVGVTNVLIKR